jgi:hypothetical protein
MQFKNSISGTSVAEEEDSHFKKEKIPPLCITDSL